MPGGADPLRWLSLLRVTTMVFSSRLSDLLEDTSGLRKEDRSTVDDGDAVVVLEAVLLLVTPYFRGRWWIRSSLEACSGRV
ncbi:hypothetical protein IscW_ISCW010735 [Ixodes scapularis]|uniref:Uncharacterized protein n=1 Tax=Ixodes scapularis TaxID=6945 RepID=B7Q6B1_IXOSC|nr:hypothetical protein IscW_ISCW010735 [Ixodes scapularis]|eukprot:XP_002402847.1 hypothetical protein IscW_ISCW010735 [Ixodes scapularis]